MSKIKLVAMDLDNTLLDSNKQISEHTKEVLKELDSKDARKGVLVYGIDGAPEGKKLIKEGMMTGTAAQSPKQMADTAINAAYQIFDGKKVPKKKVISVYMITKKNIEQTDISRWQ